MTACLRIGHRYRHSSAITLVENGFRELERTGVNTDTGASCLRRDRVLRPDEVRSSNTLSLRTRVRQHMHGTCSASWLAEAAGIVWLGLQMDYDLEKTAREKSAEIERKVQPRDNVVA